MTSNSISTSFPTLCELLSNSVFDEDVAFALELASSESSSDEDLRNLLEEGAFELNELMWRVLGATLLSDNDPEARELEANLAEIVAAVGIDEARNAYRDKLLVNSRDTLEDTRYELALTAHASRVLDDGSLRLELTIPGTENNSDVFGTIDGQSIRIEVTVLHESLPPVVHLELDEFVCAAFMDSGFRVTLRRVLANQSHAERVRALIELLSETHAETGGADQEIDGVRFEWRKGAYHCERRESPIKSIQFDLPADYREVIHPVSSRSVIPMHIIEDFEQPEGVKTLADIPHDPETHKDIPLSTKVRQALDSKRRQCEDGIVNVIAFCNPIPFHDTEVVNAVYGVPMVIVPYDEGEDKIRHFKDALVARNHKAPFIPDKLMNADEREQFVEPFRKMSAVWLYRLGTYARSRFLPNFNATNPVPDKFLESLSVSEETAQPTAQADDTSSVSERHEDESEIVWTEIADDFVTSCRGYERARTALTELRSTGLSFSELEARLDELNRPFEPQQQQMFCDPTDEELAIRFVIDSGGCEQAEACLDAWAAERGVVSVAEDRLRWIQENAYFRWVDDGYEHGHDFRHWCEAVRAYEESHRGDIASE